MTAKDGWIQWKLYIGFAISDAKESSVSEKKSLRMLRKDMVELEDAWKNFKQAFVLYLSEEKDEAVKTEVENERRRIKEDYDPAFDNLANAIEAAEPRKTPLTASSQEHLPQNTVSSIEHGHSIENGHSVREEGEAFSCGGQDETELMFPIQGKEGSFLTFTKTDGKDKKGRYMYKCKNCEPPQGSKPDRRKRAQTHGISESSIREHARDEHRLKLIWGQVGDELKSATELPSISCKFCGKSFKSEHGCKKHEKDKCSKKQAINGVEMETSKSRPPIKRGKFVNSKHNCNEPGPPTTRREDSAPKSADVSINTSQLRESTVPNSEHVHNEDLPSQQTFGFSCEQARGPCNTAENPTQTQEMLGQGGRGEEKMLPDHTQPLVSSLC